MSNPEFLREGSAVHDFLHPDRVVVGADDEATAFRLISLYVGLTAPVVVTDPASSELIKYAANAFLAAKLSFVNEVAALAEALGADMEDVVLGVGTDPRIGRNHFSPGPGWGGSCLPKDTRALMRMAADAGHTFEVLDATVSANEAQFDRMADKVEELVGGPAGGPHGRRVGVDLQGRHQRPALLAGPGGPGPSGGAGGHGAGPRPRASILRSSARQPGDGIELFEDAYEACKDADVLAVLTDWSDFRTADLDQVAEPAASAPGRWTPATCWTGRRCGASGSTTAAWVGAEPPTTARGSLGPGLGLLAVGEVPVDGAAEAVARTAPTPGTRSCSLARDGSTRRRGWPSGLVVSQRISPSKPTSVDG